VHKAQADVVQFASESARLGAFCTADEAHPAGAVAAVLAYCVPTRSEGGRDGQPPDVDTHVKERQARESAAGSRNTGRGQVDGCGRRSDESVHAAPASTCLSSQRKASTGGNERLRTLGPWCWRRSLLPLRPRLPRCAASPRLIGWRVFGPCFIPPDAAAR
jgi:hypothetical protein